MASSKVRTNVARVAAGAVFAAGASLAIAGVAQADNGIKVEVKLNQQDDDGGSGDVSVGGVTEGGDGGTDEGGDGGTDEGGDGGTDEGGDNGGPGVKPDTGGAIEGIIEVPDADEGLTPEKPESGDELAQTGASGGQAMLLIGAATMVAGGVAFRYLPKALGKADATA